MHVVATAGHVDHGKSALLRALTGTDPDRLAEEQRRGMTTDLGFVRTRLDFEDGQDDVAFVDVPGHERFVPTMLAGVGQVPAVVLVVAADGGWMPQTGEHVDALAALGVRRGLLVLSRADLADRAQRDRVLARAARELEGTGLEGLVRVEASAVTGEGLPALRTALARVLAAAPRPDPTAPVRLWVDRSFTVRGAGTVVTGTLAAGTVTAGDELALPDGTRVRVRGLQTLDTPVAVAAGPARVALNLRGVAAGAVRRGTALSTPGTTTTTTSADVRLLPVPGRGDGDGAGGEDRWPEHLVLHLGTATVPVRVRPLGGRHARLSLASPLPLRTGDRGLVRDPGGHRVLAAALVLDPVPPSLSRRGAARERAAVLAGLSGASAVGGDPAGELDRRGQVTGSQLHALGLRREAVEALAAAPGVLADGDHLLSPALADALRGRLAGEVAAHLREHPLEPGPPVEVVRRRLGLASAGLVAALVRSPATAGTPVASAGGARPPLAVREGRLVAGGAPAGPALPPAVERAVAQVLADLSREPYAAPEAHRLRDLGLGSRELAAAVRAGALERVAEGVYLAAGAVQAAPSVLAAHLEDASAVFTASEARRALATTRRVVVPLLELLDRRGATRRHPDGTRALIPPR
ncbi:selenocysteine-specific translation elongation factor [Streptomyces sp. NP160]|uniref:selenocysteine-specific translation elongation factor n=1 Tax=Streptomyces sp. NP160 TaxID=2586637 RepID=UPI001118ED3F|nr:selenocysteine-specific translation elongation factor [Streptomyces sp. NP160]TNM61142.1 selenocysteine-specific translation elongation factor [Streptomyces sp. NP160]